MRRVAGLRGAFTTAVLAAAVLVLSACTGTGSPATSASPSPSASTSASTITASTGPASRLAPTASATAGPTRTAGPHRKVLVVAEENHTAEDVLGSGRAPYLSALSRRFATLTDMAAGYPVGCPSLPAYLLMTSGSTHDVCDDAGPDAHPIDGPSIFSQVEDAGLQWRGYAESMPAPCTRDNAAVGRYLVRHAPAPYYRGAARCRDWDLPLGTASAGPLHDDVGAGSLPDYGFVTPDACDDMHGGDVCGGDVIADGDRWLATWLPQIMAGPDYREGRLVIVVTWDEGSGSSNHIPTVVVSPTAQGVRVTERVTHCGLLAMEEDLLRLPRLGCATAAPSPGPALGLA